MPPDGDALELAMLETSILCRDAKCNIQASAKGAVTSSRSLTLGIRYDLAARICNMLIHSTMYRELYFDHST